MTRGELHLRTYSSSSVFPQQECPAFHTLHVVPPPAVVIVILDDLKRRFGGGDVPQGGTVVCLTLRHSTKPFLYYLHTGTVALPPVGCFLLV